MTLTLVGALPAVGICGLGHALPSTERREGDPTYAHLRSADPFSPLFTGYNSRRVLGPEESLTELMAEACRNALRAAATDIADVDLLTGYASVSEFLAPNELFALHRSLGMSERAEVLPIADEFTTFLSGLRLAANRIWLGQGKSALVACGCRWTASVDYEDPVSASIGDGAGAAVVQSLDGRESGLNFRLRGWHSEVPRQLYGAMRLTSRKGIHPTTLLDPEATTRPLFNMLSESERTFRQWGTEAPVRLVRELIGAAGISQTDVTCIGHQASEYLLQIWRRELLPMRFEDTLHALGNMTLASIPVTLGLRAPHIETRYVVLASLGLGIHASACLLERC
jgi:3-oxoacyl-[acyl-carrier-protein] synthase-3